MKLCRIVYSAAIVGVVVFWAAGAMAGSNAVHYVITNENAALNTATFYVAGPGPTLKQKKIVPTGGSGSIGELAFSTARVSVVRDKTNQCVFVADGGSDDVAAIALKTLKVSGNFKGSATDSSGSNLGVALNSNYLYASFSGSKTIATFRELAGCKLKFVKDVSAVGMNLGSINGMALHGKMMVVTYGDGSIQSFNISKGVPVSNRDLQLSTGFRNNGAEPLGVDISKDGRFAIFGDGTDSTDVEVSNISSGKLTRTVSYADLFPGSDSSNVWLSPDGSLLYVSMNASGAVAAAFFNQKTGVLTAGCSSGPLSGFNNTWQYTVGLATLGATGTGGVVYVAESGDISSSIGIVKARSNGKTCSLTESTKSPAADSITTVLETIGAYPPRPF